VELNSVSCASAGNCTAVGQYDGDGLLLTETGGTWTAGEAGVPANASPGVLLNSVSCSSVGNCSAVGYYHDSSENLQGLLLTETAGAWATGTEATLPANAETKTYAVVSSVSCASDGNCSAIGTYADTSGDFQGLLLTETGGTWAPGTEASPPANAGADPAVALASVSCASEAGLPSDVSAAQPSVIMRSVSCASAGNCTAVGGDYGIDGTAPGLLLTETDGTWAPGIEAPLPANAMGPPIDGGDEPGVVLSSVSCASAGNCTVVGTYDAGPDTSTTGGDQEGLLLSRRTGRGRPGPKPACPPTPTPILWSP
jgi:hypothetical protein